MLARYSREPMLSVWSLENKYSTWLKVEKAIAYAWYTVGKIPQDEYTRIAQFDTINIERILELEESTKHDLIAFIAYLEEAIGVAGRYIHFGCTSSDIVDTANALLLQQAGVLIIQGMEKVLESLRKKITATKQYITIGRTHGVHAEPITYALKFASFYAEFVRDKERFLHALHGIAVGKISGAVGTYVTITPQVEEIACAQLKLAVDPISTQIIQRDRYAEYFTTIAIIAGTIERLCVELRHLQRTEVREVEERFVKGQKGSSAMPHKKNPITAENLTGLSRMLRSYALASLENMPLWHERDISHSSVERFIMPDSTITLDYALHKLAALLDGLTIHEDVVNKNRDASFRLFFSQRVLSALVETGMERQQAYSIVQKCAMEAFALGKDFPTLCAQESAIAERIPAEKLQQIFDLSPYIQYQDTILQRVLALS